MILFGTQDADHKPTQMRGFEMALPEQPQEEKRDGRKRERKNGRTNQMSGFGSGRERDRNFLPQHLLRPSRHYGAARSPRPEV